jgi:hypothetical protein
VAALIIDSAYHPILLFGLASNAYSFVLVTLALKRGDWLTDSQFSLTKFYVLMGWVPLAFLALSLVISPRYLLLFVATGLMGIVGELIVSVVWRRFFAEPIWTYSYRSVLSGYTSTLNFFPWTVGALLFCETRRVLRGPAPEACSLRGPSVDSPAPASDASRAARSPSSASPSRQRRWPSAGG